MSVVPLEIEFEEGEPPQFNHRRWLTIAGLAVVAVVVVIAMVFFFYAGIIFLIYKPQVTGDLKTTLVLSNSTNVDGELYVRAGVQVAYDVPSKLLVVPNGVKYTLVTRNNQKAYTAVSHVKYAINPNNLQDVELEFNVTGMEKPLKDNKFWFELIAELVDALASFPKFPYKHTCSKFKCEFAVLTTEPDKPRSKTCYTINENDDQYAI